MASERIQRRIEILLDEADEAIAKSDWAVVYDRAQNVLRLDPENKDALSYLTAAGRDLRSGGASESSHPPAPENQADTAPTEDQPAPTASRVVFAEAERRQLTVMFCDLQGSTALSRQLDPEELRDVIRGYQEVCAGAVSRFDGHIAKYLGDGLLIYFGYPKAHEDDPQRAVRGGLAILDDMGPLNSKLKADKDLELAVRIGVHTGLVVAGEMGGGDTIEALAIVGETPNIAARLQEVAEPNSVVISDITANLVQGFFVCEALGFHELKGISQPMELFAVLSESGAQTRFDVAASAQLTPLVGREQELGLLLDRWEQAKEGDGQVVLLSGEPGIGKSRLVDALTERLADDPHTIRRLRCSAYHQNSALNPVLEYLEGLLGFEREDSAEERQGKLESALALVDFPLDEAVPLLSELLSVPLAERFPALAFSPEVQRERSRELLVTILLESAESQPVFLVVEDLHWADPSTLAVLGLLIDQVPTANVLALLSYRDEFTPPWPTRAYMTPIVLNRLTRRLADEMIGRLTGGKALPEEVLSQVTAKSDGVPIFVEELTRMLLESDLLKEAGDRYELTGPLTPLAIPSTLQDSLTARLDRLSSAREIAQLGAVLGREFTYELIKAVSPLDEESLGSHLQQLVNAEFLYQRGLAPDANYTFKHALIQDAAYESLLRSNRQQYHQRVAEAMEERFSDAVETQPELLAHHFAEAGLTQRAVDYWLKAGQRALVTYAYDEALAHFERGLVARGVTLIGAEPATDSETAALLFGLGKSQAAALPINRTEEAVETLGRAFEYYANSGDAVRAVAIAEIPFRFPAATVVWAVGFVPRALELVPGNSLEAGRLLSRKGFEQGRSGRDYTGAQESFQQALSIAQRHGDAALEARTLADAANVAYSHQHHLESADQGIRGAELARLVEDLEIEAQARSCAAMNLRILGDLPGAQEQAQIMLEVADRLGNRTWIVIGLQYNIMLSLLEGDWATAKALSERVLAAAPLDARQLSNRMQLEYEVGNFGEAGVYLNRLVDAISPISILDQAFNAFTAVALHMSARISGSNLEPQLAKECAAAAIASSVAAPLFITWARAGQALSAVLRGDSVAAQRYYPQLESIRGTAVLAGPAGDRLLGLLSTTMGNLAQAAAHFEDSVAFCRKAGYRPELAWTCCDYADMLRERDGPGDKEEAVALLDESLAISSELGMRPLMERVQSRQKMIGV